jgi:hypothetical protein
MQQWQDALYVAPFPVKLLTQRSDRQISYLFVRFEIFTAMRMMDVLLGFGAV